jgi:hypothetical protein
MKLRTLLAIIFLGFALTACGLARSTPATEEEMQNNYDYAAGGMNFSVLLNGVGIQVTQVELQAADDVRPGYTYVVLTYNIVNNSELPILPAGLVLVDDVNSQYGNVAPHDSFAARFTAFPLTINKGEAFTGNQTFLVPNPTLTTNLKLRWESGPHESRIEVTLGGY